MRNKNDKIQIPDVEREYVERRADKLLHSLKERVVLLNAGAGYGKTQILAHYVSSCQEKSAWYSLSETDNELMSFVRNLTRSVEKALGKENLSFQDFAPLSENLDVLVERLVVWLDEQVERMNIILDDFQEIHNPDIFNLLDVLIETMSEKLRFFIVEMRSLPDVLEEYAAQGRASCIGMEDLKLGLTEIGLLLGEMEDSRLFLQAAELIYFYTEGWPVGVVQIIQQMRRQRGKMTLKAVRGICEKLEVSDYLTTRVYKMLPYDIQTFLEKTAVLDYMTAPACNYILGNYQSKSMLKYLSREKLFVQGLGEGSGIYRYHSIFQRFLLSRLSREEQMESLKKAAYYFLKTEDKVQAAEYGCRGCAPEVVQAVLETAGEEILKERLYDTLERWFGFLRSQNCSLTPKSKFVYGKYLWICGEKETARKELMEAANAFWKAGKKKEYKKALLFAAVAERKEGNLKRSGQCLEQAEKISEKEWGALAEEACTERIKYDCCLQKVQEAKESLAGWKSAGAYFREGTFLSAADRVFFSGGLLEEKTSFHEMEDGFLLQNCMLSEQLAAAYQAADFTEVYQCAQQIIQNAEYETLHTAVAWKMLAVLSWNRKNYRKAVDQAGVGDRFLHKNQIQLKDFARKHQHIFEEIDFLHKHVQEPIAPLAAEREAAAPKQEKGKQIQIRCMKRFRVLLKEKEEVMWRTKKAQELFAYLFHLQGEGVSREELIALLWPETGAKSATALFHTTLYSIRQIFSQEGWENLIVYEKKKYSLNMEMVSSELEELERCIRACREKKGNPGRMMQLYQGGYMEEMGYLWAYGTARKLEEEYLSACKAEAKRQMQEHKGERAIPFLQRMQEVDPYDEETVRNLIACLYHSGKQKEAREQYDRMVKLYKEDLELEFGKSFQELVC